MILRTEGLTKRFGGLSVIDGVNFSMEQGEIRGLIGPNGAGKTTFFNLITGRLSPDGGNIFFKGNEISTLPIYRIAQLGIVLKFQITNVFEEMSCAQNIRVAMMGKTKGFVDLFRYSDPLVKEQIDQILKEINLYSKRDQRANTLSHGEKQWLEIGMTIANRPEILLLDEPTAGMTVEETNGTIELINRVSKHLSILVIEHDMYFIRNIAHKITVLYRGNILVEGTYAEVEADERVKNIYLGREEDHA
jgi:urea transport system ATP-binding protein